VLRKKLADFVLSVSNTCINLATDQIALVITDKQSPNWNMEQLLLDCLQEIETREFRGSEEHEVLLPVPALMDQ
jgi:hypothetical protein